MRKHLTTIHKITKMKLLCQQCKTLWCRNTPVYKTVLSFRTPVSDLFLVRKRNKVDLNWPQTWTQATQDVNHPDSCSQQDCSSFTGGKLMRGRPVFMLCSELSSAAGSAWAQCGLRALGWRWRGTSSQAVPPPPSGPKCLIPEVDKRMQGSAGCCSCRLQRLCCQPPEEKVKGHQRRVNDHQISKLNWKLSFDLLLLLTLPLYQTVSLPSGSISSVFTAM